MAGGYFFGTQAQGMIEKSLELDLGIAQNVRVGRAPGAVLAQKFGKHPVLVFGGKIDVFDLDADHVGHGGGIHKIDIGGTKLRVIVILPVLHEDADDLIALLLEQPGSDRRIHAAAQPDHHLLPNVLLVHRGGIIPSRRLRQIQRGGTSRQIERCNYWPGRGDFLGQQAAGADDHEWRVPGSPIQLFFFIPHTQTFAAL